MSSVVLVLFGLSFFYLGYRFYSKFIGDQIFGINDKQVSGGGSVNDNPPQGGQFTLGSFYLTEGQTVHRRTIVGS